MASRTPTLLLVLALLVAPACRDTGSDDPEPTVDRVAAVQEARQAVADPAQQLGTAVVEVREAVDRLAADPTTAAADELDRALDELDAATAALAQVDLSAPTADVRAAADAVEEATGAAERLAETGATLVTAGRQVAEADDRLQELTGAWDQRGSRSEVLARLDEVAATADELADELAADGPDGCPGPVERRNAAAEHVAEATRELRDLVAAHDGQGYDARRAELDDAPYGHAEDDAPRRLDGLDAAAAGCPALAEATTAANEVEAGLHALEDALNPADLAG